jgi:regulatory protein
MLAKLGRRDHTEKELTTALRRKLAPEAAIERALAKLRDQGLVDDRKFAERRARSAASSGLRGPRRVVAALRQKGVAAETASSVAKEAFSPTSDLEEKLVKLAARQLRRARAETGRERRMKALRALVSRGFGLGESRRAIARAEKAEGEGDPDGA